MFHPGQKVVCIRDTSCYGALRAGRVYTVKTVDTFWDLVELEEVHHEFFDMVGFNLSRFRALDPSIPPLEDML